MTKLLARLLQHAYTLLMQHHPIGTPRDKLQLRLQPMDLSLWQQELLQTKSLISATH